MSSIKKWSAAELCPLDAATLPYMSNYKLLYSKAAKGGEANVNAEATLLLDHKTETVVKALNS